MPIHNQHLAKLFNARSICRDFTRRYDRLLRPLGLRTSQVEILDLLARRGGLSQGEVASAVGLEITTLSRTLKPIITRGLIGEAQGADRRRRILAITPAGLSSLEDVHNALQSVVELTHFPLRLVEAGEKS